jgi:hypothetical protein
MDDFTYALLVSRRVHKWSSEKIPRATSFPLSRVKEGLMQIGQKHLEAAFDILIKDGKFKKLDGGRRVSLFEVVKYLDIEIKVNTVTVTKLPLKEVSLNRTQKRKSTEKGVSDVAKKQKPAVVAKPVLSKRRKYCLFSSYG